MLGKSGTVLRPSPLCALIGHAGFFYLFMEVYAVGAALTTDGIGRVVLLLLIVVLAVLAVEAFFGRVRMESEVLRARQIRSQVLNRSEIRLARPGTVISWRGAEVNGVLVEMKDGSSHDLLRSDFLTFEAADDWCPQINQWVLRS